MNRDKTIEEAIDAGEDTTGLGTVRDLARVIIEHGGPYACEMWFMLDGKKVSIEAVVTFVVGVLISPAYQPDPPRLARSTPPAEHADPDDR